MFRLAEVESGEMVVCVCMILEIVRWSDNDDKLRGGGSMCIEIEGICLVFTI